MNKTILTTIILCGFTVMCFAQKGNYTAILTSVECQGMSNTDSNIKVDSSTTVTSFKSSFTDSHIQIEWEKGETEFHFQLKNISDQTLKVIWDDAAYITSSGSTLKILHYGVKFIDRNNSQPPTTIIKGANLSDIIAPTDNVYYSSGSYGGWRQYPLFTKPKRKAIPAFDGTNIKILLPLVIDGKTMEYVFTFKIHWVEKSK